MCSADEYPELRDNISKDIREYTVLLLDFIICTGVQMNLLVHVELVRNSSAFSTTDTIDIFAHSIWALTQQDVV